MTGETKSLLVVGGIAVAVGSAAILAIPAGKTEPTFDGGPACACAATTDAGVRLSDDCEMAIPGGDWMSAPPRVHMRVGEWRGGCVLKACSEVAGFSSWPAEQCGPESLPP